MAKCIYPITIGKSEGLKRWRVVPCGKCKNCRRRHQAAWSFRMLQEASYSTSACFITLTYSDENLNWGEYAPSLSKRDLQLFFKRLRKVQAARSNVKIRYYACGEYGTETFRPHYHAIMFNMLPELMFDAVLSEIWKLGNVRVDPCNIATIQYTSKYVMKPRVPLEGVEKEFSLMSKGIGKEYLTDQIVRYYKENQIPYVVWKDGQKMSMPRYFKERIFTDEELREFGRQALGEIEPQELNSSKVFEIEQMNKQLKKLYREKRSKI
jgi:hypothetical protein